MNNLENAKKILNEGSYTCVICGKELYTTKKRGVQPLLDLLDSETDVSSCSAADKVVGKAAAFLYVLLKVKEVHSNIISKPALKVFEDYGIKAEYDELVEVIFNRTNTGLCPMESTVMAIDEPEAALRAVREKLGVLRSQEENNV